MILASQYGILRRSRPPQKYTAKPWSISIVELLLKGLPDTFIGVKRNFKDAFLDLNFLFVNKQLNCSDDKIFADLIYFNVDV